jgi:DNA-binding NarL/FixJ family response regulator
MFMAPELLILVGIQRRSRDFSDTEISELTRVQQLLTAAFTFRHRLDETVAEVLAADAAERRVTGGSAGIYTRYVPSRREAEVLTLATAGWTNRRIANRLGITERTVRKHLTNVYEKSATSNRAAAAAWWQQRRDMMDC